MRRWSRFAAVACCAWMGGAAGAQVLDLSAPERPRIETSAVVDVVARLEREIASLEARLAQLADARVDEDFLLPVRVRIRARRDAARTLSPWLDVYSDGWRSGMLGLTIARRMGAIDAMAARYGELAVAARQDDAPDGAVVAYQRARGSLRRFAGGADGEGELDAVALRTMDSRYAALGRAHEAMYPDGVTVHEADPVFDDAMRSVRGVVLSDAARHACLSAIGRVLADAGETSSARTRIGIARAIGEAAWAPGLARVEFGASSGAVEMLERALMDRAGALDTDGLGALARAAVVLRRIGELRRSGVDTRALSAGVEHVLMLGEADGFLRVAERVLGVCSARRSFAGADAREMARELQRGWRLTARAYERLEASVLAELIAVSEEPARLREPGTVSLLASHRGLVETMRRVVESADWNAALAARGDAAALAAAAALEPMAVRALDETTRHETDERMAELEVILDSLEISGTGRALATPGSAMDRAAGGRGRELARVFENARTARLAAWARGDASEQTDITRTHEALLGLIELIAIADDPDAVAWAGRHGAVEFDARGVAAAADRVRGVVDEAVTMTVRGEVAMAADAISFGGSRAGLLELIREFSMIAPGAPGRSPVDDGTIAGRMDDLGEAERSSLALISRLLVEAGDLSAGDIDARGAVDGILAFAEHEADRVADGLRVGRGGPGG